MTTTAKIFKATSADIDGLISVASVKLNGQLIEEWGDTDAEAAAALNEAVIEFIWHNEIFS